MALNQDETAEIRALLPHVPALRAVLEELPARPEEAAQDLRDLRAMLSAARWRREALRRLAATASFLVSSSGVVAAALYLWSQFRAPPQ